MGETTTIATASSTAANKHMSSETVVVSDNEDNDDNGGILAKNHIALDQEGDVEVEVECRPSCSTSTTTTSSSAPRAAVTVNNANTGQLRLLPPLQPATEILSQASRQTYQEVREDMSIVNAKRRTQKRGAQTIDLLSQKLCTPLRETVRTYERELRGMHPFETVVMELTVRARRKKDGLTLSTLLGKIHAGRKELHQLSKDWIAKIKSSSSTKKTHECTEEVKESLGRTFKLSV